MSDKVIWCNRGPYPTYFGFCPSERAWKREMKRIGPGVDDVSYPGVGERPRGCTSTFDHGTKGVMCIVTINPQVDKKFARDKIGIYTLIFHEAVHVWQKLRQQIGEREPSAEAEAYMLQHISAQLCLAYLNTRIKRKKPKPAPKRKRKRKTK